ncbi:ATP-dependent sacrificial sulfur transferase LarE [Maridesulfovibrio zosterae]|uniref:ATP-dependent sacrificial sulfur transferase LarE n=1 Tax=Maridesulfovibrio zosterae TaxID=82171 RepID=UPI000403BF05|nr:ATP-dependent sacrificial sulfur transferase LarE [Maridesulfovibrio zosterae]
MTSAALNYKYEKFLQNLSTAKSAIIAFSGGVDSTFLLYAAKQALGDRILAVTVSTPYIPKWENKEAVFFAKQMEIDHVAVDMPFPEELRYNPPDHCYTCKKIIFSKLIEIALDKNLSSVLDGTNVDDLNDYRPGLKALAELGICSPLVEADLNKAEIRHLSRKFGLPTWNKPSFACLMSRMPVGQHVKDEALQQVEQAEIFLMDIGFKAVRVRHHGDVARIEVSEDKIIELITASKIYGIESKLKELGYRYVAVDISGYSMGSLNDVQQP